MSRTPDRRAVWASRLDAVFLALVVAGAGFWAYRLSRYKSAVRAARAGMPFGVGSRPEPAGLSQGQLLQLGWMHAGLHIPDGSYVRRDIRKRPGTRRIGLFGCSFVEGLESGPGYDLGSLLEKRLRRAGMRDVEVVNFGTYAYGMHQSYLLWTYLGRRFGLDQAVFFPEDFDLWRDDSFVYEDKYAALHARYALSGAGLLLVPLLGGDPAEAMSRYHRLLTPWRYARYDNRPTLALRVLLPPGRRRGLNPFYYWPRLLWREELPETYARIFAAVAAQGGRPIVWTHSGELAGFLGGRLRALGIPCELDGAWRAMERCPELYRAPGGHLGPLGNDLQAGLLYAFMAGDAGAAATRIGLSVLDHHARGGTSGRPLDQFEALAIGVGPHRLAGLAAAAGSQSNSPPLKLLSGLQDLKAAALVTTPPPDPALLPRPALLDDAAPVVAVLESAGGTVRIPMGRLRAPTRVVGTVVLAAGRWDGSWSGGGSWSLRISDGDWFRGLSVSADRRVSRVRIEVAGDPLLESGAPGAAPAVFRPLFAELLKIRAAPEGYADIGQLPPRGTVDLLARREGEWSERFPMFSYALERRRLAPFATPRAIRSSMGQVGTASSR